VIGHVSTSMSTSRSTSAPAACHICGSTQVRRHCTKQEAEYYLCSSCGLIFQYPPPDRVSMVAYVDAEYESGVYRDYVEARDMKLAHFQHRMQSMAPVLKRGRLLDIGCSCGYFMEVAASAGYEVNGVEFSTVAIQAAQPAIRDRIIRGTLDDIPADQEGTFDVVTAFDLIEHVDGPEAFLRKAARMLTPGGSIAISTPDAEHFLRYVMGARWPMLQPMQHLSIFSRKALALVLESAGFTDIQISTAHKTITMFYLANQLRALSTVVCAGMHGVMRLLPGKTIHRYRQVNIGELFATAKLRNGAGTGDSQKCR